MGARQSKRSVDITTTPKKGDDGVATIGAGEGEGRVEKLEDGDQLKVTVNGGTTTHVEINLKEKDNVNEIAVENGVAEDTPEENDKAAVTVEKIDSTEEVVEEPKIEKSSESATEEVKVNGDSGTESTKKSKKDKMKKKWSFRNISFSRKEKPKNKEDVKEVNEEVNAEQPAVEVSSSAEIKAEAEKVTVNGTESQECTSVASEEPIKTEELTKSESSVVSKEETAPEPIKEAPPAEPEAPAPVVEEAKPVVDLVEEIVTATQDLKIEASPVESTPEPAEKEVRNLETPPPLPVSPPPPPVSVLAMSTMADSIPADILVKASSIQPSSVEQETIVAEPKVVEQVEPVVSVTDVVEKVDEKHATEEPVLAAQVEIVSEPQVVQASETPVEQIPETPIVPVEQTHQVPIEHIPEVPVEQVLQVSAEEIPEVPVVPVEQVSEIPVPEVAEVEHTPEVTKVAAVEQVIETVPEPIELPEQSEPEIPALPSDLPEPESIVESPLTSEKQPELSDLIDSLPPPPPPVEETPSQPSFLIESLPETESDIVETSEVESVPSSDQPSLAPEPIDPVVEPIETIALADIVPQEIVTNGIEHIEAAQEESSSPVAKVDSVPVTSAPLLNDTVLGDDVVPEIKQNSVEKIDTTACNEESRDAAPKAENQEPVEGDGVAIKTEE